MRNKGGGLNDNTCFARTFEDLFRLWKGTGKGGVYILSENMRRGFKIEWRIMKSITKHFGAADISQVIEDLRFLGCSEQEVFESIAMLTETKIIKFSAQHFDFVFHPDVACSKLVEALSKHHPPNITIQEYKSYGWRRLAGLI